MRLVCLIGELNMAEELGLNVLLPESVENLQLPTPELVNFYTDLENRVYWIEDEINDYSLEVIKQILQWNKEDHNKPIEERKPIKLLFFTPGGDLDVNNAIIDVIKLSRTPIHGYNMGRCQSAGAFIYIACHKKFMLPRASFLFHQGSAMMGGTFQQNVDFMEDYKKQVDELTKYIVEHTGFPEDMIAEKMKKEWYVYQDDALKYKVCDEVLTELDSIFQ